MLKNAWINGRNYTSKGSTSEINPTRIIVNFAGPILLYACEGYRASNDYVCPIDVKVTKAVLYKVLYKI